MRKRDVGALRGDIMQKAQVRGKTRGRLGHGGDKTKKGHGLSIECSHVRMQMRVRGGVAVKAQQGQHEQ